MSHLPRLSGREVVGALRKIGYAFDHQRSSHIVVCFDLKGLQERLHAN